MVRTTRYPRSIARRATNLIICALVTLGLLATAGCSPATTQETKQEPTDTRKGYGMGGVEQQIVIPRSVVENRPAPWDLGTPESAVRSYLDWVSYGYRIGESEVATPTMTPYQLVRVDAYNQMQLQKGRLIDQSVKSIVFGKASADVTRTLLPAKERWKYRYVSIKKAGETLQGPYDASYETTYTLVKTKNGWLVDDIEVKTLGTVK